MSQDRQIENVDVRLGPSHDPIPATRAAGVNRYARPLESLGVAVDLLLADASIPGELLECPEALVPLDRAFKFAELACRAVGSEHLALHLGFRPSLDEYGSYGELIKKSLTVYEYLRKGVSLYNLLITGQRLWLTRHGDQFRLNLATAGDHDLGSYQSHIESVATTIAILRHSLGPYWTPKEICLAYRSRENLPESDLFDNSLIMRGSDITYMTIPAEMMKRAFRDDGTVTASAPESNAARSIPQNLEGLVQFQIESLLSSGKLHIDTVAESMMMSRRTLQRRLAEQHETYSHLLSEIRFKIAARKLANSDQAIAEIAFELGYGDASNFTRAFRQKTGVSPLYFRTTSADGYRIH